MIERKEIKIKNETSEIFGSTSASNYESRSKNELAQQNTKISKTYLDNDIFGYKTINSATITQELRKELKNEANIAKSLSNPNSRSNSPINIKKNKKEDPPFIPKYKEKSPRKRLIEEVYGQKYVNKLEYLDPEKNMNKGFKKRSITPNSKSPLEMRINEYSSTIFNTETKFYQKTDKSANAPLIYPSNASWFDKGLDRKFSNVPINPNEREDTPDLIKSRKQTQMKSNIFTYSSDIPRSISPRPAKSPKKNILIEPKESPEKQIQNEMKKIHNGYSDIFGIKNLNEEITYYKTQNSQRVLAEKKYKNLLIRKRKNGTDDNDNASKDMNNLENQQKSNSKKAFAVPSVLGLGNQKYDPQQATRVKTPIKENDIYDFDLKSIPKNVDEISLKQALAGYHVIELKTDTNRINGNILGTGRLKIKHENKEQLDQLRLKLKNFGILVLNHFEKVKTTSNYRDTAKLPWHDQHLQREENRLNNGYKTTRESKLRNLESEGELFGSSKNAGKWDREALKESQNNIKEYVLIINEFIQANYAYSREYQSSKVQSSQKDIAEAAKWKKLMKDAPTMKKGPINNTQIETAPSENVTPSTASRSITPTRKIASYFEGKPSPLGKTSAKNIIKSNTPNINVKNIGMSKTPRVIQIIKALLLKLFLETIK